MYSSQCLGKWRCKAARGANTTAHMYVTHTHTHDCVEAIKEKSVCKKCKQKQIN